MRVDFDNSLLRELVEGDVSPSTVIGRTGYVRKFRYGDEANRFVSLKLRMTGQDGFPLTDKEHEEYRKLCNGSAITHVDGGGFNNNADVDHYSL